jgi:hypothetical protein
MTEIIHHVKINTLNYLVDLKSSALLCDVDERLSQDLDLLLEVLSLIGEEESDVLRSDLLTEINAESGGSVVAIAVLVLLYEFLVLSKNTKSFLEERLSSSVLEISSDVGDVVGASLSLLGSNNISGLDGAMMDPLEGVEGDEVGVSNLIKVPRGLSDVDIFSDVDLKKSVNEEVGESFVVGAVGALSEALSVDSVQLVSEVMESGESDGGLGVEEEGSSEGGDDVIDSLSALSVLVIVGGGPDGISGIFSSVSCVAVVDVLLEVESDDAPPASELWGVLGDERVVQESFGESVGEDFASLTLLEALSLGEQVGELLAEWFPESESVSPCEDVSKSLDLLLTNSCDVSVEARSSNVLNSHVRSETQEISDEPFVSGVLVNVLRNGVKDDSGCV